MALKVGRSARDAQLLAAEAECLLLADSQLVPSVVELGRVPEGVERLQAGDPYLALSWVEGTPVNLIPTPSVELAWAVARDVGRALSHLHDAGLAHGDVKPANILVRQDGQELRATLVDLGFSHCLDELQLRGATPRYLPPELAQGRVLPRASDLWALGVVLGEILCSDIARCADVRSALLHASLPAPFDGWCAGLTAPDPSARCSAEWLVAALQSARPGPAEPDDSGVRRVRSSYLRVRRSELVRAAAASDVLIQGQTAPWLGAAVDLMRAAAAIRQATNDGSKVRLQPLSPGDRARWLVALVGSAAASWPMNGALAELPEPLVASSLEHLAARVSPRAWTVRDVLDAIGSRRIVARPNPAEAQPDSVALVLGLTQRPVAPGVLQHCEALAAKGALEPRLLMLLAAALRAQGELGRALACLSGRSEPEVAVERAELLRRMGDSTGALEHARALMDGCGVLAERARAVVARVLVDQGKAHEALQIIGADQVVQAAEVRALAHLALSQRQEALLVLEQAAAMAPDEESRARLACVRGMEAHSRGDALAAFEWFCRAVDHAQRAAAVIEEATYQTGLAAAAVDAGLIPQALEACGRAALMWEHLGKPGQWAYALLARACAYALAGAQHDAQAAALEACERAKEAADKRAQGFAWLVLCDTAADDQGAAQAARAAHDLLKSSHAEDQLRCAARLLRCGLLGPLDITEHDRAAAAHDLSPTVLCDWWGARARQHLQGHACGRDQELVGHLMRCVRSAAPVGSKGPALHAARALAARLGDGEATRLFSAAHEQLVERFLGALPPSWRERAAGLAWVREASRPEAGLGTHQLRNVETLVRTLAARDNVRAILEQALDALVLWTGVERGLLLLRAPDGRLQVRAARNLARADLRDDQLELSHSLAARALESQEPVVAVDAAGEISELHASVHALGLRSVLAVPLMARGQALGVAYLDDRMRRGAFGPEELAWVKLVAGVAAVAIADARDQLLLRREARRARRATQRLEQALAQREAQLIVVSERLAQADEQASGRYRYESIVGRSAAMRAMLAIVDRVTPTSVPVVITGESGVGKELVARALHENGPRSRGPFVTQNCGAIPEPLLESILFGHTKGAFTGADRARIGLFEAAQDGTLLLDEISEMPLSMQPKLLRVLQDGEVTALGATRPRKVNVRVIAATNRDLTAMVRQGLFREDLMYRLNVITIAVPALRDRPDDVPLLVAHFLERYAQGRAVRVSREALRCLMRFGWPGNVRQLENEVRRALVLCDDEIRLEHLSAAVQQGQAVERPQGLQVRAHVDALERELVVEALARTHYNQTKAAELLGLSRFGLQKMLKRLQIPVRG